MSFIHFPLILPPAIGAGLFFIFCSPGFVLARRTGLSCFVEDPESFSGMHCYILGPYRTEFFYQNSSGKMPSDKASICSLTQITPAPWCHLPGPYPLIVLEHLRPNKDWVIFIVIKTEKAVTLNPLLPCVYDCYLLSYGRPGTLSCGRPGTLSHYFAQRFID